MAFMFNMSRESDRHSKNLLSSLKRLQMNGKLCDVTVAIGDEEMRVHKTILVAASDYFEAMFSHETKESRTGKIEFPSTPPKIVKLCMDFIYTGKAEFSLKNPEELIHASDMMQLHDLTDLYIEFLIKRLNLVNCAEYLILALTYGKNVLRKPIEDFILINCPDFTKARKFELLSKEHLVYCLKLLPKANKTSEAHKWKAIVTWVKSDPGSRKGFFAELFKLLDLSMFSKEFLKNEIYKEQLVKESLACSNIMLERFMKKKTTSSLTLARKPTEFKDIYAVSSSGQALLQYSSATQQWSKYADMPAEMCNTSFFPYQSYGNLEVVNGVIFMGYGNSLWKCFDRKWTKIYSDADQNKGKCFNRCVVHGNSIYMITSADVIQYNFFNFVMYGRISSGPGLGPNFAVTCASGVIYAMGGGTSGYGSVDANIIAYKFNLNGNKLWQKIGNLISKRTCCTAFCFDGKPYVLGGINCGYYVDSVEFYEVATDKWYVVPDLKITCSNAKVYKRDQLCVILPELKFQHIEFSRLRFRVRKGLTDASVDTSNVCMGF